MINLLKKHSVRQIVMGYYSVDNNGADFHLEINKIKPSLLSVQRLVRFQFFPGLKTL